MLKTNAQINREAAVKCRKAGMSLREIAKAFPKVWKIVEEDGKECLSQKYHGAYTLEDGRKETNVMILPSAVEEAIAEWKKQNT